MPAWQAYLFATGVVLGSGMFVLTHHPFFFGIQHVGMKIRVAACSVIYKKVCWKICIQSSIQSQIEV